MMRPTWAEIDLRAFDRNVSAVSASLPAGSKIMALLKADGYGHGALELARRCRPDQVAMIGVALLEEALELRRGGITRPILVLGSLTEPQIHAALDHDITIGVPGTEALAAAANVARERDVRIHLKLDTGMGRMGVVETELPEVVERIRSAPRLRLDALYTHLANAGDARDPFSDEQIARFRTLVATLRDAGVSAPRKHIANSAATMRGLVDPGDYVRTGLALLGAEPLDEGVDEAMDEAVNEGVVHAHAARPRALRRYEPLLRWRTEIARLKELPPGHAIGYGMIFRTARPSLIATLPVGYADGYRRALSNQGEVLVRGQRVPVVGRVSMDLVTVDVTDVAGVRPGDEVVLLGRQRHESREDEVAVEELARKLDTISYEVFCAVSARVPRVYFDGSDPLRLLTRFEP